jgi:hypothetical protein
MNTTEETQECDGECGEHIPVSQLIEHPYGNMCAPCISIANIELNQDDEAFWESNKLTQMLDEIKKEEEVRKANHWAEWVVNNEPASEDIAKKNKNPPKDGAKKNIPAKPPSFIKSGSAGCQISNHLAVKKWMDRYGETFADSTNKK